MTQEKMNKVISKAWIKYISMEIDNQLFKSGFRNIYVYIYIYMVLTTVGFFEVSIESWREWDLSPRPLNSVQTLKATELSGHEFNSHSEPALYSYSNSIVCSVPHFISAMPFVSYHVCFNGKFLEIYFVYIYNDNIYMYVCI